MRDSRVRASTSRSSRPATATVPGKSATEMAELMMHESRDQRTSWKRLEMLLVVLLLPCLAHANAGLPMITLGLPFVVAALIPVIVIESWMVRRETGVSVRETIRAVSSANVVSTLVGYPVAWLLQALVQFGADWLLSLVGNAESPLYRTGWFQVMGMLLSAAWLMPFENSMWWMIPAAGMVGLIPAFFVSVYCERLVIKNMWPAGSVNLERTVLRANLASYAFLFIVLAAILTGNYLAHDPRLHAVELSGALVLARDEGVTIHGNSDVNIDVLVREASKLPRVSYLDFRGVDLHGRVKGLDRLRNVQFLCLADSNLDDGDLRQLAKVSGVETLDLSNTRITKKGLAVLRDWSGLKNIDLQRTQVGDSDLATLGMVTELHGLNLSQTRVAGRGLEVLARLQDLRSLDLQGTRLTQAGFVEIGRLAYLERLNLGDTPLTDEGLGPLRGLTKLKHLHLWRTRVTDNGLKHLRNLTALRTLSIGLPTITDAGLENLREMTAMEVLDLNGSSVKGPGLDHLRGMTRLERLWLRDTGVSDSAVASLRLALPKAEIFTK